MINGIDHYNLRSDEKMIETLKDFYINIVGLNLGHRPPFKSKGYWLYAKEKDVLHLSSSKDSIKKHLNFIEKQSLKIKLASDETGEVIESFGVWVEKKMYGRSYMGIERSTFIVSRNGKILEVFRKVKVKNHAQLVLERVQEILTSN